MGVFTFFKTSYKYCEIFDNTFFTEQPGTTDSRNKGDICISFNKILDLYYFQ